EVDVDLVGELTEVHAEQFARTGNAVTQCVDVDVESFGGCGGRGGTFQIHSDGFGELGSLRRVVGQQRADRPLPQRATQLVRGAGEEQLVHARLFTGQHDDLVGRSGGGFQRAARLLTRPA